MAKITDNPQVQELLTRLELKHRNQLEKAIKLERKVVSTEAIDIVKEYLAHCAEIENKEQRKYAQNMMRGIIENIKELKK